MPFKDNKGNFYEKLEDTICPIGELLFKDKWRLSGTGFYISPVGIALSASHNFRNRGVDKLNQIARENNLPYNIIEMSAFFRQIPKSKTEVQIEIAQVKKLAFLKNIDIALVQTTLSDKKPNRLNLTSRVPRIDESIFAYSYPNEEGNTDNISGKLNLHDAEFEGKVTDYYLEGRDSSMLPGPCIEVQMDAPGGTSGGPVFDKFGHVFGVISTNIPRDINTGAPAVTYVTPLYPILDMTIPLDTDIGLRDYSLRDLAKLNLINLFE